MSCASQIQPLQFSFQNNTLTNDGRAISNGIAVQIGIPSQIFSVTPTTLLNNTFVNNIATCGSDNNTACISIIRGGYDADASSTFVRTTSDAWNGSDEAAGGLAGIPALYFNDVLHIADSDLLGFPLLIQSTGVNVYAGLGLGSNSTFVNGLVDANLAPSKSWSMYPGVYSDSGAGSLIIGGYAERFYEGQLHTKNISDWDAPSFEVVSMNYHEGGKTYDLLPSGTKGTFTAVIDAYYPTLTVPDDTLWKWGNATNGTWSPELLLHTYSPSNVPQGHINVTLMNGLKTSIPASALFDPPAYDNGVLAEYRNGSDTVYSVVNPWSLYTTETVTNGGLFGMPYAAMVYLIRDFEKHQISIANANPSAQIAGEAIAICALGKGKGGGGGTNVGAIAGGVVAGVVGLALIAALVWFLLRRRKKQDATKASATSNAENASGFTKAELPEYSAATATPTNEVKKAAHTEPPVQEMPAQGDGGAELPGSQAAPLGELPSEGRAVRAELPA